MIACASKADQASPGTSTLAICYLEMYGNSEVPMDGSTQSTPVLYPSACNEQRVLKQDVQL